MLYEKELKAVYDEHFEKCKNCNACNTNKLVEQSKNYYLYSYATKVGTNYADALIKVLVIGQEQPYEKNKVFSTPSTSATNPHWERTLLTIAKIAGVDNETLDELEKTKNMKRLFDDYAPSFAFTNIFKCAFSKDGNWSGKSVIHNKAMAKECSKLFVKELEILKPDLIIKQGKWNSDEIEKHINSDSNKMLYKNPKLNITLFQYDYYNDKPLYVIYSYHPTCQNPNWYEHKSALYECIEYLTQIFNKS